MLTFTCEPALLLFLSPWQITYLFGYLMLAAALDTVFLFV